MTKREILEADAKRTAERFEWQYEDEGALASAYEINALQEEWFADYEVWISEHEAKIWGEALCKEIATMHHTQGMVAEVTLDDDFLIIEAQEKV